ncbi:ATP-binding protein [Nocardiopsis sp. LOL_012]|uniref:ATP-binding protein n=1 Tax=Nocardiopsis sp. LOL_012 TaxID=3345409 RepID=UPI003A883117
MRHTLSGDPGGAVKVVVEPRPSRFILTVTDDAPRPGPTNPVPRTEQGGDLLRVGGYGLRLVDALASYWDWTGAAGGPSRSGCAWTGTARPRSGPPRSPDGQPIPSSRNRTGTTG